MSVLRAGLVREPVFTWLRRPLTTTRWSVYIGRVLDSNKELDTYRAARVGSGQDEASAIREAVINLRNMADQLDDLLKEAAP